MPFISTKLSIPITDEKLETVKLKFGKAIRILPGKSESYLMLSFEDGCKMYFRGSNDQPIALVEVKLFGKATDSAYENLTAELTSILNSELGIPPSQIYVKYEEVEHWGCGGANF